MANVVLDHLCVDLSGERVLHDLDVDIAAGSFVAIVGPSGSGKSTLLRVVAGLVAAASGSIRFDGVDVGDLSASRRDIGMVFQESALLPRRNARRNVEFPLELRRETAAVIRDRVNAEVRSLRIEYLLEREPHQLSRGEEQLVQIARTMVRVPKVLLLDEPFAPLDAHLRSRMRSEISLLQAGYGVTTVMATNDPADAFALASQILVLGDTPSTIVQVGDPRDVHDDPGSLATATGLGPLAVLRVRVRADSDGFWLEHDDVVRLRSWSPALRDRIGTDVTLGVRPDGMTRHERGEARLEVIRPIAGAPGSLVCRWAGRMLTASGEVSADEHGSIQRFRIERPLVFDPDTGRRIY